MRSYTLFIWSNHLLREDQATTAETQSSQTGVFVLQLNFITLGKWLGLSIINSAKKLRNTNIYKLQELIFDEIFLCHNTETVQVSST